MTLSIVTFNIHRIGLLLRQSATGPLNPDSGDSRNICPGLVQSVVRKQGKQTRGTSSLETGFSGWRRICRPVGSVSCLVGGDGLEPPAYWV